MNYPNPTCQVFDHRATKDEGVCTTCHSIELAEKVLAENPLGREYFEVQRWQTQSRRPESHSHGPRFDVETTDG